MISKQVIAFGTTRHVLADITDETVGCPFLIEIQIHPPLLFQYLLYLLSETIRHKWLGLLDTREVNNSKHRLYKLNTFPNLALQIREKIISRPRNTTIIRTSSRKFFEHSFSLIVYLPHSPNDVIISLRCWHMLVFVSIRYFIFNEKGFEYTTVSHLSSFFPENQMYLLLAGDLHQFVSPWL